jgi:hypothetical protein
MDVYIETRGSAGSADYKFLGAEPAQSWWRRRYAQQTAFEFPTALVERDERGWRLYAGGIPSSRKDPSGRTNRVSLVAESADSQDADGEALVPVVDAWLRDVASDGASTTLQRALDDAFPDDVVTRLYDADGAEVAGEVRDLVLTVLASLEPLTTGGQATDGGPSGSWIAPIRAEAGRTAFVERVRALLAGRASGAAIFVNLADEPAEFTRGPADADLAVLVTDAKGNLPLAPRPLPKKEPGPVLLRPDRRRKPERGTKRALKAVLAVVLVIGLAWIVARAIGLEWTMTPAPTTPSPPPSTQPTPTTVPTTPAGVVNGPTSPTATGAPKAGT